jgi:glycosyltransferase involved in cell wall biosynthesis
VERIEDGRVKLFRQENQGPSAARNRGIEEAHGELVAFLDADDEWRPRFLETVLDLRAKHSEAGAYATAYAIQEPDGRLRTVEYKEIPPPPWEGIIPNFFRSALGTSPVWTSAVAIRREVFDGVGRFILCPGLGEDMELWARIALRYPIAFSWRIGAVYHREAENRLCETVFTHVFTSDRVERAMRSQDVASYVLPDVEEFLAKVKLTAVSRCIVRGQGKVARSILKGCKTRRFQKQKLWWWCWSFLPDGLVSLAWRGKRWFRRCRESWNSRHCPQR